MHFHKMNEWLKLRSLQKSPVTRGGLCDIIAVPVEDVSTFPVIDPTIQRVASAIILKYGKSWISFAAAAPYGRAFKEKLQKSKAGQYYEQSVQGTIFSQNAHNHIQLNNMPLHKWIVLARERGTGLTYLIGKPTAACAFSTDYESTAKGTPTRISFDTSAKHRAILYGGLDFNLPEQPPPPSIFLIRMLAEFRIGDPDRPPADSLSMIVPELGNRQNIAIFMDGALISQKGLTDRMSCTYDPLENEIHLTKKVAQLTLVQIYEVREGE